MTGPNGIHEYGTGFNSLGTTNGDFAGTYTFTISDGNGCQGVTAIVVVNEPAVLAASAVQLTAITCFGADNGSAKVTATGGNLPYLYAWDDGQTAATAIGLTLACMW